MFVLTMENARRLKASYREAQVPGLAFALQVLRWRSEDDIFLNHSRSDYVDYLYRETEIPHYHLHRAFPREIYPHMEFREWQDQFGIEVTELQLSQDIKDKNILVVVGLSRHEEIPKVF